MLSIALYVTEDNSQPKEEDTCPYPWGNSSDWGGLHQAIPCSPLNWLDPKRVHQLRVKACISLTWGIWMMYSNVNNIFDSIPMGIGCNSRTYKASPIAPIGSEGMLGAMGNWLLFPYIQRIFKSTPEFRRHTRHIWGINWYIRAYKLFVITPLNSEGTRGIVRNYLLKSGAQSIFNSTLNFWSRVRNYGELLL